MGQDGGLDGLDLVPEAVVVLDEDHVILATNDRVPSVLGVDQVEGKVLFDVVRLLDDAGNECGSALLPAAGVAARLAERILQLDLGEGRRRPVAMAGRYHAGGLTLTFRPAGRRERVDAARSDLIATVSHEIRSPLTSVKGFTRTMLARWERFSDEQKQTMLATINEDADRVTRLLTELLDASRIDAGRVQLHQRPVDVGELVTNVIDKARHRPDGDGRDIVVEVPQGVEVHADPDKFEQVVTNLVENALRYAAESQVRVTVALDRDQAHLSVSDDGPGVPEDQQRRIFEKFGRGRGQRRAGTGLGLFITRGLVEAHGGSIWIESPEGAGATFHVVLPVA